MYLKSKQDTSRPQPRRVQKLSIPASPDLYKAVAAAAKKAGVSQSTYIRTALEKAALVAVALY